MAPEGPRPGAPAEVLVVGAGPTGLALALWLTRLGLRVRIIDRDVGPGESSRAFAVQARTLEHYNQLGLDQLLLRRGRRLSVLNVHEHGDLIARIPLGEFGEGLSPFPFILILPQDVHEKLLLGPLAEAGVEVERETELVGFEDQGDRVRARLLRGRHEEEICDVDVLCGCDGAHSTLRGLIEAEFEGGDYQGDFYVADVEAKGAMVDGEIHYALWGADLCRVFPLTGESRIRLIGQLPQSTRSKGFPITFEDIAGEVTDATGLDVFLVEWFSIYDVHHRVADRFRRGRVFLLGDACHTHSPAGSQGLNTGIGDAVNLAWKIRAVLRDGADPRLLDTYEPERQRVARAVVATTDLAFGLQIDPSRFMQATRRITARLLPKVMRSGRFRRGFFRIVSQLMVNYRNTPFSGGSNGMLRGGDRLPWISFGDDADNFAALRELTWHVQIYGRAREEFKRWCARRRLQIREYPWSKAAAAQRFRKDVAYLVRPDGYLAQISRRQDAHEFEAFLDGYNLLPRASQEISRQEQTLKRLPLRPRRRSMGTLPNGAEP